MQNVTILTAQKKLAKKTKALENLQFRLMNLKIARKCSLLQKNMNLQKQILKMPTANQNQ